MYNIEYDTDINETIDVYIRMYWLKKSSWWRLIFWIIFPLSCGLFIISKEFKSDIILFSSLFLILWTIFLVYTYGPGYRRKIKRFIIKSFHGKPFPKTFKCLINEDGIEFDNELHQVKCKWPSVIFIQYYKQYLEIQCAGLLIHIRKEHAPDLADIIKLWENNRDL